MLSDVSKGEDLVSEDGHSVGTVAKSAPLLRTVRPSASILKVIEAVLDSGQPISGNEFRARYGSHDTLAKIALVPWVRIEHRADGFYHFTLLHELRDFCARYYLQAPLVAIFEELKRRRTELRQRWEQTEWITRVTELIALIEILNFVEAELSTVASDHDPYAYYVHPTRDALHSRRTEYWASNDKAAWIIQLGNVDEHRGLLDWIEAELGRLLLRP